MTNPAVTASVSRAELDAARLLLARTEWTTSACRCQPHPRYRPKWIDPERLAWAPPMCASRIPEDDTVSLRAFRPFCRFSPGAGPARHSAPPCCDGAAGLEFATHS
jgi:hypothetical protein